MDTLRKHTTKQRKQYSLMTSLALFVLSLLIIVIFMSGTNQLPGFRPHILGNVFEVHAAMLGIWLAIIATLWASFKGKFDPFEPPFWISLNVYIQVILNVWWLQRDHSLDIPWASENYDSLLSRTVLLFGVALTALWFGYIINFLRTKKKGLNSLPSIPHMRATVIYAVWCAGWLTSILSAILGVTNYLGTGAIRVFANYFFFINLLYLLASSILIMRHFRNPAIMGWIWLAVFMLSEIGVSMVVGTKTFALTLIFLIMCIYYALGKINYRFVMWVGAGLILIIICVPIITNYRLVLHSLNPSSLTIPGRINALGVAIDKSMTSPLRNLLESTGTTFKVRQGSVLDISASVMYLHPTYKPFIGKEMVSYFFQQIIPRVLWPNKPTQRPEIYMISTIYAGRASEYTFSDIGLFADSYRAGGWPVVIIFFMVLGCFSSWLYLRSIDRGNLAGVAFYILVLNALLRYDFPIVTLLVYLLEFGTFLWLFVTFVMFEPMARNKTP